MGDHSRKPVLWLVAGADGWSVNLLYFAVASPEQALARIGRRVSEGGHDIPEADVAETLAAMPLCAEG